EQASNGNNTRRRLFADDTAQGFAFIDLCFKRYDVVLMNPPFGEFANRFRDRAREQFASGNNEIFTAFIERGCDLRRDQGLLGAISSRTAFFQATTEKWRTKIILPQHVFVWIELGADVLDSAMVETVAYVLGHSMSPSKSIFVRPDSDQPLER